MVTYNLGIDLLPTHPLSSSSGRKCFRVVPQVNGDKYNMHIYTEQIKIINY